MVKRQRRMTTRKKTGVKNSIPKKKSAKPSKGKQLVRSSKKRPAAKTDRASQALKVLLKGLNQKEETE